MISIRGPNRRLWELKWDFLDFFCTLFNTCRPSDSTVSEDAGVEPRTYATSALAVRRSNHSARSHPHPATQPCSAKPYSRTLTEWCYGPAILIVLYDDTWPRSSPSSTRAPQDKHVSAGESNPVCLRHRQTLQQRATGIRTAYAVALLLFGTSTRLPQRMARKERM